MIWRKHRDARLKLGSHVSLEPMGQTQKSGATATKPSGTWLILLVVAFVILCAIVAIPNFDDSAARRNEASAVGTLRQFTDLQRNFGAAFPSKGYACDLRSLHPVGSLQDGYDRWSFLTEDAHRYAGYFFSLKECTSRGAPNGHYFVVAVPAEPGKSGDRAFCSDESGVIYYDKTGSADACLARKNPLN